MSLRSQSTKRSLSASSLRNSNRRLRQAAAHTVERLESRCMLSLTDAQAASVWDNMSTDLRHDVAVLEYIYPQFQVQLDADLESRGLSPIAPEAGTLPGFGDAPKGKLHRPHHHPAPHPKPPRRHHHTRDGGAAPTVSFSYFDSTGDYIFNPTTQSYQASNELKFTFNENVTCNNWNSALTIIDLNTPSSTVQANPVATVVPPAYDSTSDTVTYNLTPLGPIANGNYVAILDGSRISANGANLLGTDGVPGHQYFGEFYFLDGHLYSDKQLYPPPGQNPVLDSSLRMVSFKDFATVVANFGKPATYLQGDLNYDGVVNFTDFAAVASVYGNQMPQLQAPGSLTLAGATADNITLSWPASSDPDVTHYDVYRDSTELTLQATGNGPTITYTDSNVPSGTHTYFVVARGGTAGSEADASSSYPSPELIATTAPQVSNSAILQPQFLTDSLPQKLAIPFNQNMTAVNWTNAVTIINLNTKSTVVPTTYAYSSDIVTYTLTNTTNPLPNANYAVILHSPQIVSDQGIELAGNDGTAGHDYLLNFSFLQGDVAAPSPSPTPTGLNPTGGDNLIDSNDVNLVQTNATNPPTSISYRTGSVTFDGAITSADVSFEQSHLNQTLPILTTPTAPTATAATTSVTLTWPTLPSPVTYYDIYRNFQWIGTATIGSFSDNNNGQNLNFNTTYTYFIVARDSAGDCSYNSGEAIAKTGTPLPTAPSVNPTNLTPSSPTSILFSWTDPDTTVTGYNIYRSTNQSGPYSPIATDQIGTTYLDSGLSAGTQYYYEVTSVNSAGESAPGTATPFTTAPRASLPGYSTTPPQSPGVPSASLDQSGKSITITWSPSPTSNVTYQVSRNGVAIGGTSSTSYTDSTVTSGVSYTYSVTAYDSSYNYSTVQTAAQPVSLADQAPNAPLDLQVTKNDGTAVTIGWVQPWDDVGVTGYNIYRDNQLVKTQTDTTYNDTSVSPGATHTYYVAAVDGANHNTNSPSITVTIPGGSSPSSSPIDSSPSQFITPAWQNDFYNNLTPVLRDRIAAIPNVHISVPSAQYWYDPTDTLIGSATIPSSVNPTQIQGTTGAYCYLDSHGNGSWTQDQRPDPNNPGQHLNFDDPVWQDVDHTGIFRQGEPVIDQGNGTLKTGDAGKTNGIFSATVGAGATTLTLVWKSSTSSFSQDFANFYTGLNAVLPYYANGGGDIDNPSSTRLSAGFVLQSLYGGTVNEVTIPNDTLTITESNPGVYQITDTANALSTELQPGDNVYINGTWYPLSPYYPNNNTLELASPYLGKPGSGLALTIRNWTLVPALSDSGTGAKFTYERGLPTAGDLVFQQQFAELHYALGMMNTLAPFYDQTYYAARSAQFISVASDVANAYESVFGVSTTPGTDDYVLRNGILSGDADPGAIEYSGIEAPNGNSNVSLGLLRDMVDQLEGAIYVRGGPNSTNGWVTDQYGNPITFSEDEALLKTLLPTIPNPLDHSIIIRSAGNWSGDSFGRGVGTGSPIDPTIQLSELETMLQAMETGAGMYFPPVGNQPPTPVTDQKLWIAETLGPSLQSEWFDEKAKGGSSQDPTTPQPPPADGSSQQQDVPYPTMPDPSGWHFAPATYSTGEVITVTTGHQQIGFVHFSRSTFWPVDQSTGKQVYDLAVLILTDGALWWHFPNQNPNSDAPDLGSVLPAPTSGPAPTTSGLNVTIISWTEDEAQSWLLNNDPGWPPQEPTPDTGPVMGAVANTEYYYNSEVNAGTYKNDQASAEVDAFAGSGEPPSVYADVVLSDPINYTPPSYNPPSPGTGPQPGTSKPLAPMPTVNGGPTAPFPLTTRMDYENTTSDTNVDGIVQVTADLSSFGNDTGVMAFQADRNAPQVFLPIFTDTTGALPVHGYLQQGAFSTTGVDGNALLSDELSSFYSQPSGAFTDPTNTQKPDGYNQYLNQKGVPYAYSLDTYTRINEILDDGINHVKRIEVIRPGGNAVVFDFPWVQQTNSFSPIGTPLGYLVNGVARDIDRTYVLRDLTTNDASEISESGGSIHSYALEFASGITQTFAAGTAGKGTISSVSNAQGLSQDLTQYLGSPPSSGSTSSTSRFNQAIANNTTDNADSTRYNITFNLSNSANTPAYQGRIESIDYQTITPAGSSVAAQTIHVSLTYDANNNITAVNKTLNGNASNLITPFSYSLNSTGGIEREGVTVTRTGTFTNGAGSTVTITTTNDTNAPGADASLVGSLADAVTFNNYGMVTLDVVTLDEGYSGTGIPTPTQLAATTRYFYHSAVTANPGLFATAGHYANGVASWGEVTRVINPDHSWIAYVYDDGTNPPVIGSNPTGWVTEQITPFQSSTFFTGGEASNVVQYYFYDAALSGNGQGADPMNLVELPRRVQTQVLGTITSDVFNRYGAAGTSAETTVVTRRAISADENDNWDSAVFQTQNTISYTPGTGPNTGLTAASTGFAGNSTSTSSVDASNNVNSTVTSAWGTDTLSNDTESVNPWDNAFTAADGTIDQPYVADSATSPDAFGNYTTATETGGVNTNATYPNTNNFWLGPSTATEKDGSTTDYTYNAMGEIETKIIYANSAQHSIEYSYTYDMAGHVISLTTLSVSNSNLPVVTSTYQYDGFGRLYQEIDNADGQSSDPTAKRTTTDVWTYNASTRQNVLTITNPDGGTQIDTYNLDGTLASVAGTAVTPASYSEGVIAEDHTDATGHGDANVTAGSTWSSSTSGGTFNTTTSYTDMLGEQYLTQQTTPGTNSQHAKNVDTVTLFDSNGRPTKVSQYNDQNTLTIQTLTVYDPITGQAGASIADMNLNGVYDPGTDRKTIQTHAAAQSSAGNPVSTDSQDMSNTGVQDSSQTTTLGPSGSDVSESDNQAVTDTKTTPPAGGGWITTTTNPDGTKTVDTYADGLLVKEQHLGTNGTTDIVGPTTYTYDGLRRMLTKTDYTGTTSYSYFPDGTLETVQTPGHAAQQVQAIDPANNAATATQRPDTGVVQTPQNLLGQASSQSGAGLLSANFGYDVNGTGQLAGLTTFQGSTSLNNGALSGSGAATTSWQWDQNTGLLASKTYADNTQDRYEYNSIGQLINVIEPGITSSSFGYDAAGEQTSSSYTDAVTGTVSTSTTPDDLGRPSVSSSTDNGKTSTEITRYNSQGQLQDASFDTAGAATVDYGYYPSSGFGATGSPQALSSMTIQSLPNETLPVQTGYAYDSITKRLNTISLPGTNPVTITYQYFQDTSPTNKPDASNQVSYVQVNVPGTSGTSLTYQRDTVPGGNEGRITQVNTANIGGGAFSDFVNGGFNSQDQIQGQRIIQPNLSGAGGTDNWTYAYNSNNADALTGATDAPLGGNATNFTYNYDGVGNRTGSGLGSPNSVNEYPAFVYNLRGDETADGTFAYGWDALDRLISVTPVHPANGSQQEKMGYDSQSRMLWQDVYTWNTTTSTWQYSHGERFVWDNANLIAELDQNNNLLQSYTWGPTGLIAITDYTASSTNPTTYLVVTDLSSNVRDLVNVTSTDTLAAEYRYGPFGENPQVALAAGLTANPSPFGFASGWTDPICGLVYFQHRWYSPTQGRFISEDPAGIQGGYNVFSYAANDPINKSDPSGMDSVAVTYSFGMSGYGPAWGVPSEKYQTGDLYWQPDGYHEITNVIDDRVYSVPAPRGTFASIVSGLLVGDWAPMTTRTVLRPEAEAIEAASRANWQPGDMPAVFTSGTLTVWYDSRPIDASTKYFESALFQQADDALRLLSTIQVGQGLGEGIYNALHLLPGSSISLDLPEAVTGKNAATGAPLSDGQRLAAGTSVVFSTGLGVVLEAWRARRLAAQEALVLGVLREVKPLEAGVAKIEQHHIIPQGLEWWLKNENNAVADFNVDNYVVDIPDWYHDVLHAGGGPGLGGGWYNDVALDALRRARAATGEPLTHAQILAVGEQLRRRFQIDQLPVHPYIAK